MKCNKTLCFDTLTYSPDPLSIRRNVSPQVEHSNVEKDTGNGIDKLSQVPTSLSQDFFSPGEYSGC